MKKPFHQTRLFFVMFCIAFWTLMFFAIPSDGSPRKYKGHAKQERLFQKRKAANLAEQERIQTQGIKHYNPRNKWQKKTKYAKK